MKKMSKVNYHNIIGDIVSRNTNEIEDIVYIKDDAKVEDKCNYGIVFGGVSMIPHRVSEASKLYKKGLVEKLIVSGGIGYTNADRNIPEALKMQDYLIQDGIPKSDIIMESQARSSYENIKYSLEIIRERNILNNTKLALITSDFHLKRCMAMMAMAMDKQDNFFGFKAKDGWSDRENWQETFNGKKRIWQEALALCYYVKHGTISDFEIDSTKRERTL